MLMRFGEQLDPNLIDPALLQASVLEQLIGRALLRQAIDDLNIMASPSQIDELVVRSSDLPPARPRAARRCHRLKRTPERF